MALKIINNLPQKLPLSTPERNGAMSKEQCAQLNQNTSDIASLNTDLANYIIIEYITANMNCGANTNAVVTFQIPRKIGYKPIIINGIFSGNNQTFYFVQSQIILNGETSKQLVVRNLLNTSASAVASATVLYVRDI